MPRCFQSPGEIVIKNTIDDFKSSDKKKLINDVAQKVNYFYYQFTKLVQFFTILQVETTLHISVKLSVLISNVFLYSLYNLINMYIQYI